MDPSIVLDFLSSLIHIPELWKGTESKVSQVSPSICLIKFMHQIN